jgi:TetR/AcrR family transcriptional repressor of nem operon
MSSAFWRERLRVSREQVTENRRTILEVAGRLFREHGFEAVTVAEIMQAAGLTHGGFYGYFASKDAPIAGALADVLAKRPGTSGNLATGPRRTAGACPSRCGTNRCYRASAATKNRRSFIAGLCEPSLACLNFVRHWEPCGPHGPHANPPRSMRAAGRAHNPASTLPHQDVRRDHRQPSQTYRPANAERASASVICTGMT